jgi:hypothetical protein
MLDWLGVPPPPEKLDGEPVWRPGRRLRRPDDAGTAAHPPHRVRSPV